MDDFEKELRAGFLDEAEQSLTDVEQCFLALETEAGDAENLNRIFRLAHNLKGSSKAVGFDQMGAFTHQFETFILKIKNGELAADGRSVSLLLKCNDFLRVMVSELKANMDQKFDDADLLDQMQNFSADSATEQVIEASQDEIPSEIAIATIPLPIAETAVASESDHEVEIEPNLELLAELMGQASVAPPAQQNIPPAAPPSAPPSASAPPAPPSSAPNQTTAETLRVAVSKVESLLNAVGEMVILQSVLREQISKIESPLIRKTVMQMGKLSKEIQDFSMGLRMTPVKPTFQKMQRIVRDTSASLGKDVTIHLVGEETEIDKTVLEKLNDPLVHLIRNSVDHGIENASLRKERGKQQRGQVTLSAAHKSGKLVIEVRDDGGGLDPERLKAKAVEKGLLQTGAILSEKDAFALIFAPGFSTKEQVTDVSGRGVGMDVVRTNIRDLNGDIEIESKLMQGTVFRITLPLTLAIIDGMVVTQSNQRFVIPLNHVHETLQPTSAQIQSSTALRNVLLLRGENLPLVRLGEFFGLTSQAEPTQMIAMVIRSGPQPFALLVDDVLGQFQVVVKQLGPELKNYKGVSGSTILGDGKPALIIEPLDLRQRKLSPQKSSPENGKSNSKGVAA